ncbi:MAG: redoxin family protein [Chloroflexi bacterium]|nr:redoxin family protein [Chloroflexota bacterium]
MPPDLPVPIDDGACAHLGGVRIPHVSLPSTAGRIVQLDRLTAPRTIIYCYPMTAVPGTPLPEGWDLIPGARGCTPESCAFRDNHEELAELGADVFGLSTQTADYQKELAARLHLPFEVLSDAGFHFCDALHLPTFNVTGRRLIRRLTLVVRNGAIEVVFYPVYPPDTHANEVIAWLHDHPS